MSNSRLTTVRNRLALFSRTVHEQFPLIAAFVGLSFVALARVGECVTGTRRRRVSLASSAAMLMMVGPAAAQVGCDNGALSFLSDLYALVSQSAGLIILSMVIAAGVMKMIPTRGTNSIGNALIGGVLVGIVFLVVGPALVEIAGQSSPIAMDAQCGGG